MKYCPHCKDWLPRSEFGICRALPDGQNTYCRASIRIKVAASRQRLREYKATRRRLRTLSPADRVREAIRLGRYTQTEIVRATKLSRDEVTDCLATLLLWDRTITTRIIREERMYFINETPGTVVRSEPVRPSEPRSYGVSQIYFAA